MRISQNIYMGIEHTHIPFHEGSAEVLTLLRFSRSRRSLLPIDTRPPLHQCKLRVFHVMQGREGLCHEAMQHPQVHEWILECGLPEGGYGF